MAAIIIAAVIAFAVFMDSRNFIRGKGSCDDYDRNRPVKDEMHRTSK